MTATRSSQVSPEQTVDDRAFDALADERRRATLRCLLSSDDTVGVADLARDVAATEREAHHREIPTDVVERVYVSLHHRHLPKLADEGYLCYDDERTSVTLTPAAASLEPLLEWAERRGD